MGLTEADRGNLCGLVENLRMSDFEDIYRYGRQVNEKIA